MFGRKTPLEKGLDTWTKTGGSLSDVLGEHAYQAVRSSSEAKAVGSALDALSSRRYRNESDRAPSSLQTLTAFFQNVDSEEAFDVFATDGLPRLRTWVRELGSANNIDEDDVLFIMKILAMYQQRQDVDLIANAALAPLKADGFLWSIILGQFGPEHPFANDMIDALRDPLPTGFILVSYLDMANALAIAGKLNRHPFDSDGGRSQLETWLRAEDEESYSYAHSATAALPFIDRPAREPLLRLAYEHPSYLVRMEAAWAHAKSGDPEGLARLSELCLDPRFSHTAQQYLSELGHTGKIPAKAREAGFQAVAELANWLAHPSEFGRPPDRIDLFDTRELFWPPTNDTRQLSLVKYEFDDESGETEIGVGMVGSVTFALFGEATADLSAEDIYSLHCCWELEMDGDPRAPKERTPTAGRKILAYHNPGF